MQCGHCYICVPASRPSQLTETKMCWCLLSSMTMSYVYFYTLVVWCWATHGFTQSPVLTCFHKDLQALSLYTYRTSHATCSPVTDTIHLPSCPSQHTYLAYCKLTGPPHGKQLYKLQYHAYLQLFNLPFYELAFFLKLLRTGSFSPHPVSMGFFHALVIYLDCSVTSHLHLPRFFF